MAAPIINHYPAPHPKDDESHPIPHLHVIDVAGYRDGGADLSVVIASPLQGDAQSQTRLLDKIEGYLGHITTQEFRTDAGSAPTPENTTITVVIHPDSSPDIFALLDRCGDWVRSGNATLVVRRLTDEDLGGGV
jgi:hypothetical protein